MINIKFLNFSIISLLIFIGCKSKPIPVYDLDPFIKQTVNNSNNKEKIILNICNEKILWDSIAIIGPYFKVSKVEDYLNVNNFSSIEDKLDGFVLGDDKCTLLFIKNKSIIYYDTVFRKPVDFASLNTNTGDKPVIILKKDCNKFVIILTEYEGFYNLKKINY